MSSSDPVGHSDSGGNREDDVIINSREQALSDYQKRKKKWYPDVKNTPCARNSLIHGILGGLATGLLYFLKSNVVIKSCDFAIVGFVVIGYGSWRFCRYQMVKQHIEMKKTVDRMNEMAKDSTKTSEGGPNTDTKPSQQSS